jgi:hypothetical protein
MTTQRQQALQPTRSRRYDGVAGCRAQVSYGNRLHFPPAGWANEAALRVLPGLDSGDAARLVHAN